MELIGVRVEPAPPFRRSPSRAQLLRCVWWASQIGRRLVEVRQKAGWAVADPSRSRVPAGLARGAVHPVPKIGAPSRPRTTGRCTPFVAARVVWTTAVVRAKPPAGR